MIKRSIKDKIVKSLSYKEITIIVGARQIGKTTLLKEIIKDLKGAGESTLYFNLDIEADNRYFASQDLLLEKIKLEIGTEKSFIFIDEIQQKENAGLFLKGIYDMDLPYKFIITGSGSMELKERISEALTGRKYLIQMYPVTFDEFVHYKTDYRYEGKLHDFFRIESHKTDLMLNEYLQYGGYPAVVTAETSERKFEIMNEIFTSYLTKDISFLLNVRQPDKFVKLIRLLATMIGYIINYSQLTQSTGLRLSTLKTYLWYAEQTYILRLLTPFFKNKKKELTKSPTAYFHDIGMLNFLKNSFVAGFIDGFTFQNFVYILLRNRFETNLSGIQFWRTKDKAEVDFIIHQGQEIIPVEVKYSQQSKAQITRSLQSFIKRYQPSKVYIVNLKQKQKIMVDNTEVLFIPYWELLEKGVL